MGKKGILEDRMKDIFDLQDVSSVFEMLIQDNGIKKTTSERVKESNGTLTYTILLPEFKKEDISIEVSDYLLNIKVKTERKLFFSKNTFNKSYRLDNKYDIDSIKSKFEDSVLTITIDEKPKEKGRTITID